MDFDFPADDDPRRLAVRAWREANPEPTQAELHEAGYVVPHWPEPWGIGADPIHQIIIQQELAGLKVKRAGGREMASNAIGVGWAARQSCSAVPRSKRPAIWIGSSPTRTSGVSSSPNPTPVRISPTSPPGLCVTATST